MKKYIRKILKSLLVVLYLYGFLSFSINIVMSYEAVKQNKNLSFIQVFIKNLKEGNDFKGIINYYKYGNFNDFMQTNKKIKMKDEFYKNPSRSIESKVNSFLNSYSFFRKTTIQSNNNEIKIVVPKIKKINNVEDSLYGFNELRKVIGLNEVKEGNSLNISSDAHAVYLVNNKETEHDEYENKESYYSKSVNERIIKAGYNMSNVQYTGEVFSVYFAELKEGHANAMMDLFNAIYHRFIMIDPDMSKAGFSERSGNNFTAMVIDSVINKNNTHLEGVVYPFDGQEGVVSYFDHKSESPDPMPELPGLAGFAISFSVGSKHELMINSFELIQKENSKKVKGKYLMPNSSDEVGNNNFGFIPFQPLKDNTTYIAHIKGIADNKTKIDYKWSFTTL